MNKEQEIKELAKYIKDIICVDCEYKDDVCLDKAKSLNKLGYRKESEVAKENKELKKENQQLQEYNTGLKRITIYLSKLSNEQLNQKLQIASEVAKEILERIIASIEVGNNINVEMLEDLAKEYGVEL